MSSTRRKQNNPTKSASDIRKKEKSTRPTRSASKPDPDEPSLARSRPQRKIIPKRPLSPDVELSSRRKKRRKKKPPPVKPKPVKASPPAPPLQVHIPPEELKPMKLKKHHKASLKKKKKRKRKTFVFPILAADRVPRPLDPGPSLGSSASQGAQVTSKSATSSSSKKRARPVYRNVLDVDLLRMLPAADLVKKFAKHTSFKVPTEDSRTTLKQHVYTCRMLPHYCTEKFYGNDEDTKRQATKHLLRHVGELLTVTNRGIHMMTTSTKKPKPEKTKHTAKNDSCPSDSTMYILPSAPRPMRVTLPKNVSSRMKRSSYTVIRSAEGDSGINEVVLLPKGRLIGVSNPSKKKRGDGAEESQVSAGTSNAAEYDKVDEDQVSLHGGASGNGTDMEVASSFDSGMTGLSIESLAEAVEAMVDKESQGLNIQAAEALAKAMLGKNEDIGIKVENDASTSSQLSQAGNGRAQIVSPTISPGSSLSASSSKLVKQKEKKSKKSAKAKKKSDHLSSVIPNAVEPPHSDHNYALTSNNNNGPVHLDSEGRPTDTPPNIEESEPDGFDVDPLLNSMNDQLNKLIADIDAPQPSGRVSNENEEPVVGEGANVTVEMEDEAASKPRKSKPKIISKGSYQTEEVKQTAIQHLTTLARSRKRKGPFECQICHKELTAASTLRAHYRSHAGIKPYQCDLCKATFTRLHSLKYHTMIHNKEARFRCSYCHRQFRHSSHYREHLRRHTGEEPFGCSDCPARFKTRNTYKRHLRGKHGKVVSEDGKINLAPNSLFTT
ncbi:uncharacterized protein [Diadema setosum]|uniref:uncharacterized protein n=1 Tax=Diadema setosum TaxID=31175 RepID=UPI003B3A0729